MRDELRASGGRHRTSSEPDRSRSRDAARLAVDGLRPSDPPGPYEPLALGGRSIQPQRRAIGAAPVALRHLGLQQLDGDPVRRGVHCGPLDLDMLGHRSRVISSCRQERWAADDPAADQTRRAALEEQVGSRAPRDQPLPIDAPQRGGSPPAARGSRPLTAGPFPGEGHSHVPETPGPRRCSPLPSWPRPPPRSVSRAPACSWTAPQSQCVSGTGWQWHHAPRPPRAGGTPGEVQASGL